LSKFTTQAEVFDVATKVNTVTDRRRGIFGTML